MQISCKPRSEGLLLYLGVYLSVSDIVLNAKATGFHSLPSFCTSTALRPKDDASADTFMSAAGLYRVRVVSSSLIHVNATCPQLHALFLQRDLSVVV